jgi:hypothetical protein
MAARVTSEEVAAVMAEAPDDLTPFIEMATLVVDEELSELALSAARLKMIEKLLACHFAATVTPLTTQESAGVSVSYQRNSVGNGLASTQYGQNAISLDTTGTLLLMSKGSLAGANPPLIENGSREPWQAIAEETTV